MAHEDEFAVLVAIADAVADHALAQQGGELGSEIAHLVGVRKENQIGFGAIRSPAQGERRIRRRVVFEQVVFDEQNFGEFLAASSSASGATPLPMTRRVRRAVRVLGDLLRGNQRFEADVVPFAFALFGDDENFHG